MLVDSYSANLCQAHRPALTRCCHESGNHYTHYDMYRSCGLSALLQNMLQEFMTWHGSLLRWLADKETDPNMIMARKLSDLNLKAWQIERRRRKWEAQQELRQGTHLAELRDGNNKRFHDMSATEQRVLEDFDCGKLDKRHDDLRVVKPNHWR